MAVKMVMDMIAAARNLKHENALQKRIQDESTRSLPPILGENAGKRKGGGGEVNANLRERKALTDMKADRRNAEPPSRSAPSPKAEMEIVQ